MSRRRLTELLLARWGFAVLVAMAITTALVVGLTVTLPTDVPAIALQASVVYRVEVGAAVFFALYVAIMAFALALQNRGFTEIGTGGLRARDLASESREEVLLIDAVDDLFDELRELQTRKEATDDG